jgi:hypothetical protein
MYVHVDLSYQSLAVSCRESADLLDDFHVGFLIESSDKLLLEHALSGWWDMSDIYVFKRTKIVVSRVSFVMDVFNIRGVPFLIWSETK